MTAALTRRAALNEIADERIAFADAQAAALAEAEQREKEKHAEDAKRLERGRKAARLYIEGAESFEKGLALLVHGLATMRTATPGLLRFPDSK